MEYEHMNLENINSPEYEAVIGDDYETPVENNPQPEERNTQVTVNLPTVKANEKKNRLPMTLRILLAVVIVQVAIIIFLAVLSWKLFSHEHDMSNVDDIEDSLAKIKGTVNRYGRKLDDYFSIAFSATISQLYPTINQDENAIFDTVTLNRGNGYDSATGVFTVPDGGAGLYYMSTHLVSLNRKYVTFIMYRNNENLCGLNKGSEQSSRESGSGSCSVTVELNTGDRVFVKRIGGSNNTPLSCYNKKCGFTGFLMKPTE